MEIIAPRDILGGGMPATPVSAAGAIAPGGAFLALFVLLPAAPEVSAPIAPIPDASFALPPWAEPPFSPLLPPNPLPVSPVNGTAFAPSAAVGAMPEAAQPRNTAAPAGRKIAAPSGEKALAPHRAVDAPAQEARSETGQSGQLSTAASAPWPGAICVPAQLTPLPDAPQAREFASPATSAAIVQVTDAHSAVTEIASTPRAVITAAASQATNAQRAATIAPPPTNAPMQRIEIPTKNNRADPAPAPPPPLRALAAESQPVQRHPTIEPSDRVAKSEPMAAIGNKRARVAPDPEHDDAPNPLADPIRPRELHAHAQPDQRMDATTAVKAAAVNDLIVNEPAAASPADAGRETAQIGAKGIDQQRDPTRQIQVETQAATPANTGPRAGFSVEVRVHPEPWVVARTFPGAGVVAPSLPPAFSDATPPPVDTSAPPTQPAKPEPANTLAHATPAIAPTASVSAPTTVTAITAPTTHLRVEHGEPESQATAPDSLGGAGVGGTAPDKSASTALPEARTTVPLADFVPLREAAPMGQAKPAQFAEAALQPAATPDNAAPPDTRAHTHFESIALPPDQAAPHRTDVEIGVQTAPLSNSERSAVNTAALHPHGVETGAAVVRQLIASAAHSTDRVVEVSLAPEELGRVRMTLTTVDHGMSVALQAERPETLDLMRRHIDQLARDFRDLGYSSISFSFGDRPQHQQAQPDTPAPLDPASQEPQAAARAVVEIDRARTQPLPSTLGGLDLRL